MPRPTISEARAAKAIERGVERAVIKVLGDKFQFNVAQGIERGVKSGVESGLVKALRIDQQPINAAVGQTLKYVEADISKLTHGIGLAFTEAADRLSVHLEHVLDDIPHALGQPTEGG